jgi:hypothetical protein
VRSVRDGPYQVTWSAAAPSMLTSSTLSDVPDEPMPGWSTPAARS